MGNKPKTDKPKPSKKKPASDLACPNVETCKGEVVDVTTDARTHKACGSCGYVFSHTITENE